MMTLLKQVMEKAAQLPPEEQEILAKRWLLEIEDALVWDEQFAKTPDASWERMAAMAARAVEDHEVEPLESLFEEDRDL